jgi:hypothetical protein
MSRADTPRGSFSFAYKSSIIYLQNVKSTYITQIYKFCRFL